MNNDQTHQFGRTPATIIALVRVMLDVHPDRSIVVVAIDDRGAIKVTMRSDLSADPAVQAQNAEMLAVSMLRVDAHATIVVSFHPDRLAAYGHRAQVIDAMNERSIPVAVEMHATDDRIITDDGAEHALPSPDMIEQVRRLLGRPKPVDRDEKVAAFEPITDEDVAGHIANAATDRQVDPSTATDSLDALCGLHLATGQVTAEDVAEYLLDIARGTYRDAIVTAIARPEAMPNQAETLTYLARRAPRSHAGHAYGVAALALYLSNDAVGARVAAEQALSIGQHYVLAQIVDKALRFMVSPQKLRELLADLAG